MEAAGVPREHGPIGMMLAEHTLGRSYVHRMNAALEGIRGGTSGAIEQFAQAAHLYINLLTAHIAKENRVLFPMADARLSPTTLQQLGRAFHSVETETLGEEQHGALLQMLAGLEEKYPPPSRAAG
jgi:hemerythrin-like domain-containing protein